MMTSKPTTCSMHGGYDKVCPGCRGTPSVRLAPGDIVCILVPRFEWPGGYVNEYHFGIVRNVKENGRADGYTDIAGLSRIVGSAIHTWGVPASVFDVYGFGLAYKERSSPVFSSFAQAQEFARPYLKLPAEPARRVAGVKVARRKSVTTS